MSAVLKEVLALIGWHDPARRATLIRTLIGLIGYLVNQGKLPQFVLDIAYSLSNDPGSVTMLAALFINAGDKNKP